METVDPGSVPHQAGSTINVTGVGRLGASNVVLVGRNGGQESFSVTTPSTDYSLAFTLTLLGPTADFANVLDRRGQVVVDVEVFLAGPAISRPTHADQLTLQGPVITSITPVTGPVTGGTSVTINGKGFTGAMQVDFDLPNVVGMPVSLASRSTSDSSITVMAPKLISELLSQLDPRTHILRLDVQVDLDDPGFCAVPSRSRPPTGSPMSDLSGP